VNTGAAPGRDAGFRGGRQVRRAATLVALIGLAGPERRPPEPPRYRPLQLDCARYQSSIRTDITIQAGRRRSRETAGRDGVMVLRAGAADSLIAVEAWFDSLTLWRESEGERQTPDTDGLIGGRYRGRLTPLGGFTATDTPFIPDEIAELADLSNALGDLLPPLPPVPLELGASWKDDFGTVISRTTDTRIAAQPVQRYRLVRRAERQEKRLLPDSTEVSATRTEKESGVFSWSPEQGLVRWERDLAEQVTVPAGGLVKQPFKTGIVQKLTVVRVGGGCGG
jgi:hypothetical protein